MLDPKKVRLGICPIGWSNDDMWDLGDENTFQQCISEMKLAGFDGCEVGHKYPEDKTVLKHMLDARNMTIASKWFSSFLVDKPYEEVEAEFVKELEYLSYVGATAINVSEQSGSIQGQLDTPVLDDKKRVLTDEEWDRFTTGLNKLGKLSMEKYGIRTCFHHHMGTVCQTVEETTRLMENTDPKYVFLCFDTGHFTFAGEDPVKMLEKFADRVGHVHLKNMRMPLVEKARAEHWSFLDAVRAGAFTVPGDPDGCVEFDKVFDLLDKAGYSGWIMVEAEQDPAKANPFEYAKMGREYITKHTGLGGEVVSEDFPEGNANFVSYINNAMADGADVIFCPVSTNYAQLIIEAAAAQGFKGAILGTDTVDNNMVLESTKGKDVRLLVTTFYQEGGSPEFDAGIKQWLNENPDMMTNNGGNDVVAGVTAMGYDAYFTALAAIKAADSTDPAKILEALPGVHYEGVTGVVEFDEIGDAKRDAAYIKEANPETGAWEFVAVQTVEQ